MFIHSNGNVISSVLTTSLSPLPSVFTASQRRRWLEPALLLLPFFRFSCAVFVSPILLFLGSCCTGVPRGPSGVGGLCHSFSPLRPRPRQQSGHGPKHCLHGCPSCSSRHHFSLHDGLGHSFLSYFLIHTRLCSILRFDTDTTTNTSVQNTLCLIYTLLLLGSFYSQVLHHEISLQKLNYFSFFSFTSSASLIVNMQVAFSVR